MKLKNRIISIILGIATTVCLFGCTSSLNLDGVQRITPRGKAWSHVSGISWSPDGSELALAYTVGRVESVTDGYVYVIGMEKGKPRILTLTKTSMGEVSGPAWSPTSNQIAFFVSGSEWDPGGIWLVHTDDTEAPVFLEVGLSCAWSPDGEQIAIAEARGDYQIYILNTYTGKKHQILQFSREGQYAVDSGISWSPKGDKLAFSYGLASDKTASIYELDLVSGESRLLIEGGVHQFPSWSSDGTMVAFSGGPNVAEQTLVIIRTDDGSTIKPLDIVGVGPVAWSPDGNTIAFEWKGSAYTIDTAVALREWLSSEE